MIETAENACSATERPDWFQDYIDRLNQTRLNLIEQYLRENGNILPGQIAQAAICAAGGAILGIIPTIP